MIYLLITFILDNVFSNIIGNTFQNISYFFPLIFVCSIPICFSLIKSKKIFLLFLIFFGIIYDTLYSDIFLVNTFYFILYYLFLYIFYCNKSVTFFNLFLICIFGFLFYDVFVFLLIIFLNYDDFTFYYLCYKISHSLVLNVFYVFFSIFIFKSRIFGFKKYKYKR